jgi:Uma2 family endonuclease
MVLTDIRRFTVREYHQLSEAGILDAEESTELLSGQIVQMVARGTPHRAAVTRIWKLLENRLGDRVLVCPQEPVELSEYSEPEPDIAVLKPDPLFYEAHHPYPSDIYLLIEVADTTFKKDCEIKASIYADSGILDYWVLNLKTRKLHVFRDSTGQGYQSQVVLNEFDQISPLAFPDVAIAIGEMLRPIN